MVNSKEYWSKIIIGILAGISWIVMISVKTLSDVSITVPLVISIIATILFVVVLSWRSIQDKMKNKKNDDEIPEPISNDKIMKIIKEEAERTWNHLSIERPILGKKTHNINNNLIYEFRVKIADTIKYDKEKSDEFILLINATYPNMQPTLLSPFMREEEIVNYVNLLSRNPKDDPNIQEEITENPMLGITTRRKTITHNQERKDEEKKEDIV